MLIHALSYIAHSHFITMISLATRSSFMLACEMPVGERRRVRLSRWPRDHLAPSMADLHPHDQRHSQLEVNVLKLHRGLDEALGEREGRRKQRRTEVNERAGECTLPPRSHFDVCASRMLIGICSNARACDYTVCVV
jgi:aromatic ring-cleaving dioxygenase